MVRLVLCAEGQAKVDKVVRRVKANSVNPDLSNLGLGSLSKEA